MARMETINAPVKVSFADGHVTLKASCLTLCINFKGFIITY